MTDFLTRLTARSFSAETAIRPRLASLFEPVRTGKTMVQEAPEVELSAGAVAGEIEAASADARTTSNQDPGSAAVPQLRADAVRHRTSGLDDETMREKDTVDASKVTPRGTPASFPAKNAIVTPASSSSRSDLEGDVSSGISIFAGETREQGHTVVAAREHPPGTLLPQSENSHVSKPASFLRLDLEDGAPTRVAASAPDASPVRHESFKSKSNARGLVLPSQDVTNLATQMKNAASAMNAGSSRPTREKAGSALFAPAADPEPSIHVTIGRIEVRATSESKNVGRPRAASPVMSLEEYLHRRTQGGDR